MSRFSFLEKRSLQEEIMDDFSCDGEVVDQTLRELHLINTYLGGNKISTNAISQLMMANPQSSYKLVDLGCGGGDTLLLFARWAKRRKQEVELIGIDANEYIVKYAQQKTIENENISFQVVNIFDESFKKKIFDIAHGSLFLHHFQEEEVVELLIQLIKQVRIGIVINDLHRHWLSYWFTKNLIVRWSKSEMVKFDSVVSVQRSFTKKELENCLHRAGISNYQLKWRWAFRWELIIWK